MNTRVPADKTVSDEGFCISGGEMMIDFSKKGKKTTRVVAAVIAILLVVGMVIGLLVTII